VDEPQPEPADAPGGADAPAAPQRSRRLLWVLLTPIVLLSVAGTVADAVGPALVTHHPLVQMFLNPRNRYLALASNQVGTVPFFVVGFLRLVLTDPLFYVLGVLYGDAALRWMEKKMGDETIQTLRRWFGKAAYPIVLIAPNGYVCLLAGATGMRPAVFISLNLTGTVARLIIIRAAADVFSGPLNAVLRFLRHYQWWLTGLSVVIVTIQVWSSRRKGRSEIASVATMERELAEAEAEVSAEAPEPD
jgi:membrane protein DedA with SNARE-associated domain